MRKSRNLKWGKLIGAFYFLLSTVCFSQTHTFPGNNVFPSTSTTDFNAGATVDFTGATVTGLAAGGGNVSNSGTPTVGQKALWVTATTIQGVADNSLQWDGGSTSLVAATARTSLALVPGTNVEVPLTFSTGLTRSTNTVTVNTSQNIATLSNLTTNGFVKTGSSVGTLSVDTATYQPSDADLTTWAGVTPTSGIQTWLATPSSANLRGALTDENGTGAALFSGATTPDFTTGFTIGAAAAAGKIPIGNGTNYIPSTPTWPTTAGTAGYTIRSDGTNIASYPQDMLNSSTASVTSSYNADTYLVGSSVVVTAGDIKLKGQYHCVFDMAKAGAGTGIPIITVRAGTLGTTGDTAIMTFTFGAGTGVADLGVFDVWVNIRTTGASATSTGTCLGRHNLATTGIFSNAAVFTVTGAANASFNSTTATTIGLSFTGGATFTGTNTFVQSTLVQ